MMTSLGYVIMWKENIGKWNKHKSCEHREHGGRDQSQVKNRKILKKYKLSPKSLPNDKNNDMVSDLEWALRQLADALVAPTSEAPDTSRGKRKIMLTEKALDAGESIKKRFCR